MSTWSFQRWSFFFFFSEKTLRLDLTRWRGTFRVIQAWDRQVTDKEYEELKGDMQKCRAKYTWTTVSYHTLIAIWNNIWIYLLDFSKIVSFFISRVNALSVADIVEHFWRHRSRSRQDPKLRGHADHIKVASVRRSQICAQGNTARFVQHDAQWCKTTKDVNCMEGTDMPLRGITMYHTFLCVEPMQRTVIFELLWIVGVQVKLCCFTRFASLV